MRHPVLEDVEFKVITVRAMEEGVTDTILPLKDDEESPVKNERLSLLKSEYKLAWDYYLTTLDERARVFDIYFKIVALPFGLVGAFILLVRTSIPRGQKVDCDGMRNVFEYTDRITTGGSLFFFLAAVSGMICFAYYSMESGNSTLYLNVAKRLRKQLFDEIKLEFALVPKEFITQTPSKRSETFKSIRFWRGMILAVLNSAFVFVGLWFWSDKAIPDYIDNYKVQAISMFAAALLFHVLLGEKLSRSKEFGPL